MIELTLGQIAAAIGGKLIFGDSETLVSGKVDTDSRNIGSGDIFFAKLGEHDDGHRYLQDVKQQGAALAIVSEPDPNLELNQIQVNDTVVALSQLASHVLDSVRSHSRLKVVGITGSNGKTSTKNMLREILSTAGKTIAPRDSFNNEVGLPLTVLRLEVDTQFLVLELGAAGPGSIAKLASWCNPDIGIELKVGLAHSGVFGSIEDTARIKQELMPYIKSLAILNQDDPYVSEFEVPTGIERVSFGFAEDADYRIEKVELSLQGTNIQLRFPDGSRATITLKILGEHQAMNVSAALAASDALGVDRETAIAAVSGMQMAERWRMQLMSRADGVFIINDAYNASPDSMRAALQTLATLGRQGHRTIAILGQMAELGDGSALLHDEIGRLVVRFNIDQLYVVGNEAKLIHMGASQEGSWDGESKFCQSATQVLELIHDKLLPGDVVLVKSSNVAGLRFLGDELAGVK